MTYTFYDNQKDCANTIVDKFKTHSYVILCAQMQSGKTGTYLYASLKMLCVDKVIDNLIIISGVCDTDLRKQTNDGVSEALNFFLDDIPRGEARNIEDRIEVLFNQDLKNIEHVRDRTLIVWDESHYAQSQNNRPNKWFNDVGLNNVLNGNDFEKIKNKGICVLSVSATPFSEIINREKQIDKKGVVFLSPPPTYRGLGSFIEKNKVFEALKITKENKNYVKHIFAKYSSLKKYIIIRTCDGDDISLREIISELEFKSLYFDSKTKVKLSELNSNYLNKIPEKTTVIIVKGRCRLGCVLTKKHIGLVYETSMTSKSDTQFQSLWGRMCGTPSNDDNFTYVPEVYVTRDNIKRAKTYVNDMKRCSPPIIDHAMNVPKKRVQTEKIHKLYPSIPIKFDDNIPNFELKDESDIIQFLISKGEKARFWNGNNHVQIRELKYMLGAKTQNKHKISKRDMTHNSYKYDIVHLMESYKKQDYFKRFEPRDENERRLIWVDVKGDMGELEHYFSWWTEKQDPIVIGNMKKIEKLPTTTGIESFSLQEKRHPLQNVTIDKLITPPKETCFNRDLDLIKKEICDCIKRSEEDFKPGDYIEEAHSRISCYFTPAMDAHPKDSKYFVKVRDIWEKLGIYDEGYVLTGKEKSLAYNRFVAVVKCLYPKYYRQKVNYYVEFSGVKKRTQMTVILVQFGSVTSST